MNKPTIGALTVDVAKQLETIHHTVIRIADELDHLRPDSLLIDCLLKRRDAAEGGDYLGAYMWDRVIHLMETQEAEVDQPDGSPLSPEQAAEQIEQVVDQYNQSFPPGQFDYPRYEDMMKSIKSLLRRKKAFKRGA